MGIYLPKIFIFERILNFFSKKFGSLKNIRTFAIPNGKYAEIAQLVEHNLAKVGVASSSLVFRSKRGHLRMTFIMRNNQTWYNYICSRSLTETAFFFIYKFKQTTPVQHTGVVFQILPLERCLELLEEAEVVFEVVAEVAHLPFEHCDTLYAHTEGESAVFLAVDA